MEFGEIPEKQHTLKHYRHSLATILKDHKRTAEKAREIDLAYDPLKPLPHSEVTALGLHALTTMKNNGKVLWNPHVSLQVNAFCVGYNSLITVGRFHHVFSIKYAAEHGMYRFYRDSKKSKPLAKEISVLYSPVRDMHDFQPMPRDYTVSSERQLNCEFSLKRFEVDYLGLASFVDEMPVSDKQARDDFWKRDESNAFVVYYKKILRSQLSRIMKFMRDADKDADGNLKIADRLRIIALRKAFIEALSALSRFTLFGFPQFNPGEIGSSNKIEKGPSCDYKQAEDDLLEYVESKYGSMDEKISHEEAVRGLKGIMRDKSSGGPKFHANVTPTTGRSAYVSGCGDFDKETLSGIQDGIDDRVKAKNSKISINKKSTVASLMLAAIPVPHSERFFNDSKFVNFEPAILGLINDICFYGSMTCTQCHTFTPAQRSDIARDKVRIIYPVPVMSILCEHTLRIFKFTKDKKQVETKWHHTTAASRNATAVVNVIHTHGVGTGGFECDASSFDIRARMLSPAFSRIMLRRLRGSGFSGAIRAASVATFLNMIYNAEYGYYVAIDKQNESYDLYTSWLSGLLHTSEGGSMYTMFMLHKFNEILTKASLGEEFERDGPYADDINEHIRNNYDPIWGSLDIENVQTMGDDSIMRLRIPSCVNGMSTANRNRTLFKFSKFFSRLFLLVSSYYCMDFRSGTILSLLPGYLNWEDERRRERGATAAENDSDDLEKPFESAQRIAAISNVRDHGLWHLLLSTAYHIFYSIRSAGRAPKTNAATLLLKCFLTPMAISDVFRKRALLTELYRTDVLHYVNPDNAVNFTNTAMQVSTLSGRLKFGGREFSMHGEVVGEFTKKVNDEWSPIPNTRATGKCKLSSDINGHVDWTAVTASHVLKSQPGMKVLKKAIIDALSAAEVPVSSWPRKPKFESHVFDLQFQDLVNAKGKPPSGLFIEKTSEMASFTGFRVVAYNRGAVIGVQPFHFPTLLTVSVFYMFLECVFGFSLSYERTFETNSDLAKDLFYPVTTAQLGSAIRSTSGTAVSALLEDIGITMDPHVVQKRLRDERAMADIPMPSAKEFGDSPFSSLIYEEHARSLLAESNIVLSDFSSNSVVVALSSAFVSMSASYIFYTRCTLKSEHVYNSFLDWAAEAGEGDRFCLSPLATAVF